MFIELDPEVAKAFKGATAVSSKIELNLSSDYYMVLISKRCSSSWFCKPYAQTWFKAKAYKSRNGDSQG